MHKKIIFIILAAFLITSCGETYDSVKRGLTGAKQKSTDEFFIQKKDPLILPPDYENLPTPEDKMIVEEETSIFENTLEETIEEDSAQSGTIEESILRKIQSK